ncbi:MAG: ABC transporter ATP-binding protein [Magnetococcales bacterium]|nr:ABC transporter ATP-binding protein [Magnetococcales bacterium]
MAGDAIVVRGVCKKFADQRVLDRLDLRVVPGELFGLVGGNGVGKTTLLQCILDFLPLDGGEIQIFGVAHTVVRARIPVSYLPERFNPPPFLTGREFLHTMARFYGNPWNAVVTEEMSGALALDPVALDQPIRTLSKGMTQKLGLAACLLSGKAVLLLDEPMSGLDPQARILLKRRLLHLQQAQGTTVLFNTHLLADVAEICDRMGILHRGQLCFVGTPAACLAHHGGTTLEEAYLRAIQAV